MNIDTLVVTAITVCHLTVEIKLNRGWGSPCTVDQMVVDQMVLDQMVLDQMVLEQMSLDQTVLHLC